MSALRAALRTPTTAWPTVIVGLGAASSFVAAMIAGAAGALPLWAVAAVSAVAAFVSFTPMHDASHRSVSRHRWLNEWIGRLASVPLAAPFAAFRYVHLEHHKHTNDPALDPDHYAGRGPRALLPLRWLTQDLHYYAVVLARWSERPRRERLELVAHVALLAAAIAALVATGHGTLAVVGWLLPARLAIGALSFAFDYLPHVPHRVLASDDRYQATRVIIAPGLTPLFLFQNYHLIHHLYPGVPFYRYRRIFEQRETELRDRGADIVVWPRPAT